VLELRLQKLLDSKQLRGLGARLRSIESNSDVSRSMGAVPGAEHGTVWVAWESPDAESGAGAVPVTQALREEPSRDLPWRLGVARQLCVAIDQIHRAGRCHGSLSPRNLLVSSSGDVSIQEAGLVDALLEVGALREHDLLGLLGLAFARYLPPEGWHVPRSSGPEADRFALGLILLEVLDGGGAPNSECKTLQQLSAKLLPKRGRWAPQVSSTGLFASLPQFTQRRVLSCFAEDPRKRPTAQELLFSLAAPEDACAEEWHLSTQQQLQTVPEDADEVIPVESERIPVSSLVLPDKLRSPTRSVVAEAPGNFERAPRHLSWPPATGMSRTVAGLDAKAPLPPPPPQRAHSSDSQPAKLRASYEGDGSSFTRTKDAQLMEPRTEAIPLPPPPPARSAPVSQGLAALTVTEASPASSQDSRPPSPPPVSKCGQEAARLAPQARLSSHSPSKAPQRLMSPPPPEPGRPAACRTPPASTTVPLSKWPKPAPFTPSMFGQLRPV